MPHSRTYFLRNPITTEVFKTLSNKERLSLKRYGWTDTNEAEWQAYAKAKAERAVMKMKPKFASGLQGRLH